MARVVRWDSFHNTRFTAVADPDERGSYPEAHVDITKPEETPIKTFGDPGARFKNGRTQGELFQHTPGGEVHGLFAHPDMAAHIPTLLGLAVDTHRRQYGNAAALPLPDSNLSDTSSRMVRNLRGKGVDIPVNPENPGSEATNDLATMDRRNITINAHDDPIAEGRIVPQAQVKEGYQTFKDVLRAGKAQRVTSGPQFNLGG